MNKPLHLHTLAFIVCLYGCASSSFGQSLGNTGTVEGTVTDPSGAVIANAKVEIRNPISGYRQDTSTDSTGNFRFHNVPPNPYHLQASSPGFAQYESDVTVRNSVPISLKIPLTLAGGETTVRVEAAGNDLLEAAPYAHNDMSNQLFSKLPTMSPGSELSDAITLGVPGVAADANGFFHPLGDHAQVSFSIDGQNISDQQSKVFSTQLPLDAVQSMELITGSPAAEYGDKTSLVVSATTRSGLGQPSHGSVAAQYGSFGTVGEEATLGFGTPNFGNFIAVNGTRSGRFLDTPEFDRIHDIGNNQTIFDRSTTTPRRATRCTSTFCWPATGFKCPTRTISSRRIRNRESSPTMSRPVTSTRSMLTLC